jgi:hypothetical protein
MVHCCVHNSPSFALVQSLINPVYSVLLCFFQTRFITVSSVARSFKILSQEIPHTNRKFLKPSGVRMCEECSSRLL